VGELSGEIKAIPGFERVLFVLDLKDELAS
jgi:hypothetical protein